MGPGAGQAHAGWPVTQMQVLGVIDMKRRGGRGQGSGEVGAGTRDNRQQKAEGIRSFIRRFSDDTTQFPGWLFLEGRSGSSGSFDRGDPEARRCQFVICHLYQLGWVFKKWQKAVTH